MGLGDIEAYVYRADLHCGPCINEQTGSHPAADTEKWLDILAQDQGIHRQDEHSFDSGDFPKVALGQHLNDATWDHCGTCGDCLGHEMSDCETGQEEEIPHADYPHEPGRLYDCEACESRCHCTGYPGHVKCVFCALLQERHGK